VGILEGKRPFGESIHKWMHNIKLYCMGIGELNSNTKLLSAGLHKQQCMADKG
jgi:hypothetical protein